MNESEALTKYLQGGDFAMNLAVTRIFTKIAVFVSSFTRSVLYDLLTNKFERIELKPSHDAYREYKKKSIAKLTSFYSKEDMIECCTQKAIQPHSIATCEVVVGD